MRIGYIKRVGVILIGAVVMVLVPCFSFAGDFVIKNGTIITVKGDTIQNGTLIIKGDRIAAVGHDVEVPENAEIIDARGLFVYPGMIDGSCTLGLYEIGAVSATVDAYEIGTYNPHIKAMAALNPHSVHIPISRVNGITSALVVPGGGIISGQSAFINLNGWTQEEMVLKSPVGIHINFPRLPADDRRGMRARRPGGSETVKKRTEKQISELIELFNKARRYSERWESYLRSKKLPAPEKDLMLEALVPVIKEELPVIISVNAEKDIKNAIEFVDSMKVKAIFSGVNDGWEVAPLLAKHNIPVLVGPVLQTPGPRDPFDARYVNACILNRAGVKIAFITNSAADVRNLPYHAGMAAAYGLPKEEALKAVTIYPAEIFGLGDILGTIEPGKLANIIVTDGDPLEVTTHVKHLFIAGEKVSLKTKHTELYEKFRKRPKK